jgi:hypothetical protein
VVIYSSNFNRTFLGSKYHNNVLLFQGKFNVIKVQDFPKKNLPAHFTQLTLLKL